MFLLEVLTTTEKHLWAMRTSWLLLLISCYYSAEGRDGIAEKSSFENLERQVLVVLVFFRSS